MTAWEKPGPGTWELDSSHCGPAPGPVLRDLYEQALPRGMREGFELFGSPLKTMEMRWVNGKFYRRLVPIVGGRRDLPQPPPAVLWVASRLHPAFRRQERRAKESFETKRWRTELRRWEEEWKPSLVKANLAFADVDVSALSDDGLITHIRELHGHLRGSLALHFRLHVSDMGPLGNLMIHLEDWGLAADDTFRALVAASPATRQPVEQLRGIVAAMRDAGVDPAAVASLDHVRSASPEAAGRLDEYLRHHGWRLTTGYDIEDRTLAELPDVVTASIRAAARPAPAAAPEDHAEATLAALREEVPADHRAEFDDLVEDARLSYGLRDENGPITYEWPGGLLRRALLDAGRRLAAAGRLDTDGQVFELSIEEVTAALTGGGPTLEEVRRRADGRREWASLEPPARLGPEEAPPPVSVLPPNLARITRIVLTVVASLEADPAGEALTGVGVGDTPYVGTARVVHDASEALVAVEPGDVIVAPYTAPTYNAVLAVAGAVVTEEGGLLCHAAVLARELGLAAVIGAVDALDRIPDGSTVEVDPTAGRVRVLT